MEINVQIRNFVQRHKGRVWIFVGTFICGYLIHFYMFTNKFLNYFEMNNLLTGMSFRKGDTVQQGKWMIPVLSSVSTVYSMPVINGLLGLTFLSFFTLLVCDLLRIRSRFFGTLVGCTVMTFPSVASYFAYGVNSDLFCMAACMGVLGVWVVEKGRTLEKRAVRIAVTAAGVTVIGLAIGAYQPFFSVAIAAVYTLLFLEVTVNGLGVRKFFRKVVFYGALLAAAFLVYYAGLQICIRITGVQLGDYHGVNEMTSFTLNGIIKGFVYSYFYYLYYFFSMEYANFPLLICANAVLAAVLLKLAFVWGRKAQDKEKGNTLLRLLMLALLPLGTNAAPFLMADRVGNGVDRYMMISVLFTYFILIKLISLLPRHMVMETVARRQLVEWVSVVCITAAALCGAYMCNQAYFRMESMTNQENAYFIRVAGRMESTAGWRPDMPVYLANCRSVFNSNYDVDIPQFDALTRMDGTELKPWYNASAIAKYMRVYLHFPIEEATKEQIGRVEETAEYRQMGMFPAEDSVKIIDGVMVVKMNEDVE